MSYSLRSRAAAYLTGAALTTLVMTAVAAPAAHATVGLLEAQGIYAGPIKGDATTTPASGCTADVKAGWNSNTTFDPSMPVKTQGSGLNIPSVEDIVPDRRAGAHSDYCVAFRLTPNMDPRLNRPTLPGDPARPPHLEAANTVPVGAVPNTVVGTGDDMARAIVDLPVGYQGNPAAIAPCPDADFALTSQDPATCAPATQVGTAYFHGFVATFDTGNDIAGQSIWFSGEQGGTALSKGAIYNLSHGPNELARLGVNLQPLSTLGASKFIVRLVLTDGPNPRVRTITEGIPTQLASDYDLDGSAFPNPPAASPPGGDLWPNYRISVESIGLKIWGSKANHPTMGADSFSENATDCTTDQRADAAILTLAGTSSAVTSAPHTLTDCGALAFQPSLAVSTTSRRPGVPTGVTVKLGLGQSTGARQTALLRDAAVTLPPGLEVGAQAGTNGLSLCTTAQFNAASPLTASTCPAATVAGTVKITSPLLTDPLVGKVFLGPQPQIGVLPQLLVEASLPGATAADAPRVKLVGTTSVDDQGRVTATFNDNPQLRFSELELTFPAGPNALFSTPKTCGTHASTSSLRSRASTTAVSVPASITIDQGCDQIPAFAPTVSMTTDNPQAGAFSPTQVTIERPDGAPWLDDVKVSLPSGFLADLNVPSECAAAQAAAGDCPESSRIASVQTVAGAGPDPLTLPGSMYLTGPQPGVVAGVVIVVHAKIGDVDLGNVVVPGALRLRPTDAGIDFSSDLPTRFRGLALNLRKVVVNMDRPGFALNPSTCGPVGYSAAATGDGGETAAPSGAIAYSGCGSLPFAPKLSAKLTGDVRPLGHPGMFVELTKHAGESNLKSATVLLPDGVAADLKNVQVSCSREQFDAVSCPASTRVGTTTATVSITSELIVGDIYLVKVPGETLPGLGLSYNGRFAQRVMSVVKINPQGRLITRFDAIPDLPLRKMTVDVTGGPKGPLQLGPDDCANGTRWDATFGGQGGQVATDQTGLRCAAKSAIRLSDKSGLSLRNFDFGGRNLKSAKVTLPAGWAIDTKRAKKGKTSWARLTGATAKSRFAKKSVTLTIKGTRASTLRLKIGGAAIKKTSKSKSKKAKTVSVKVRFAFTDGAIQNQTIRVKAR